MLLKRLWKSVSRKILVVLRLRASHPKQMLALRSA
jgi:hypothetical protein